MKYRKNIWILMNCLIICFVAGCNKEESKFQENNQKSHETDSDDGYVPIVKDGKIWAYANVEGIIELKEFFYGDTVISEKSYMKLYNQYIGHSDMDYVAALREQDKKVYCVLPTHAEEWLAYDFCLTLGDEFGSSEVLPWLKTNDTGAVKAVLSKISSYELDNHSYHRFYFDVYQDEPYNYPNSTSWIEGVGALNYPVYAWMRYIMYDNPKDGRTGGYVLYYCEDNGKTLYKNDRWGK